MSLKAFHLVFIILSFLLSVACAYWAYSNQLAEFGIGSAVVAAGLVVYGIWFIRKSRNIIT